METSALSFGTIVKYNGNYALLHKINESNKAQLIAPDGAKLSGTPNVDKLVPVAKLHFAWWKLNLYAIDKNKRIFSQKTGKIVFAMDCPQRIQILANVMDEKGNVCGSGIVEGIKGITEIINSK